MNHFIKNIHVNKLFHLENFDIPVVDEKYPHLIITGKNGSGKTILLNAVTEFLNKIKGQKGLGFLSFQQNVELWAKELNKSHDEKSRAHAQMMLEGARKNFEDLYSKVDVEFKEWDVIQSYDKGDFVIAFYQAARKPQMSEP